jgi:hypothetical protein
LITVDKETKKIKVKVKKSRTFSFPKLDKIKSLIKDKKVEFVIKSGVNNIAKKGIKEPIVNISVIVDKNINIVILANPIFLFLEMKLNILKLNIVEKIRI